MPKELQESLKDKIRTKATELGFDAAGFAKAERLETEEERLNSWLNNGFHAGMSYMRNHYDKRLDPTQLAANYR